MRISGALFAIVVLISSLAISPPEASADLGVTGWSLQTGANDKSGSSVTVNRFRFFPAPTPLTTTDSAQDGVVYSASDYAFNWDTSGGSFNWGFTQEELGSSFSPGTAQSSATVMNFSITGNDMLYDFSGTYSSNSSTHWLNASVTLTDVTPGGSAFDVFNWNELHVSDPANPPPSFVVGEIGHGNGIPTLDGTPAGTLLAGRDYALSYSFLLRDFSGNSGMATAVGGLNLNISSGATINNPAPGAVLLAVVGLPFLAWFKRRVA